MQSDQGSRRIVVVTGASRGVGKGIALALGATGATVYLTGRGPDGAGSVDPGALDRTAEQINRSGGLGIAVPCDHADDAQVQKLFERIQNEHGCLDILVNNAAHVSPDIGSDGPFWERSFDLIDMLDVGVRSTFVASFHAAPLLVKSKAGLLVSTSGYAGGCYLHGPAYGACKAATDKMAVDMGIDLRPYEVCSVSLWMGLVRTEYVSALFAAEPDTWGKRQQEAESPEFIGRVISALHKAPDRMKRSAKVWIATELGLELGVKENDGSDPESQREKFGGPLHYNPPIMHR